MLLGTAIYVNAFTKNRANGNNPWLITPSSPSSSLYALKDIKSSYSLRSVESEKPLIVSPASSDTSPSNQSPSSSSSPSSTDNDSYSTSEKYNTTPPPSTSQQSSTPFEKRHYDLEQSYAAKSKYSSKRYNNKINRNRSGKSSSKGDQGYTKRKSQSSFYSDKTKALERVLASCREGKQGQANTNAITVTLTEANHAITTAGRMGRINDAIEIFKSITTSLDYTPDLMSYNNLIWCAGNSGRIDLAKKLFTDITKSNLRPNVYSYGSLLHGFAKSKNYKQALLYLDRMIAEGLVPNQIVFTSTMEACAAAGQYREALGVMDRIVKMGFKPDRTMVNTAIKACSLAGAMEEAESLAQSLREFGSMDLFTYHTLMMGNTKLQRHSRVLSLYEEAVDSSAKLDGGIYSLAMLASLNQGLYIQVPRIATTARDAGVQLTEAAYTILIQAYAELGASDLSLACLDTMTEEGLTANVITYSAIMAACKDKPRTVLGLLDRMRAENVDANTVVLSTAIHSLARGGGSYTEKAYEILQDMEANGPEPNIYTYNNVVRVFAEAGKLDEALEVLQTIRRKRLVPDRYTFTTLLMACGRTNSSEEVAHLMNQMRDFGVMPDAIAYGAAMDAHRRAGNSLAAVQCLSDMHKSRVEPTAAHYNLVIRTLRAQGYVDKMFRMVVAISLKDGARINGNTFELVVEALLEQDRWRESLQLVGVMDRMGYKPSLGLCLSLLDQLERARQYKAAFAIYRYMVKSGYDFYENTLLNDVFKRLVNVAAKGIDAASTKLVATVPLEALMDSGTVGLESYSSTIETMSEKLSTLKTPLPTENTPPDARETADYEYEAEYEEYAELEDKLGDIGGYRGTERDIGYGEEYDWESDLEG